MLGKKLQPADLVVLQLVTRCFDFHHCIALLGRPETDQIWQARAVVARVGQQALEHALQMRGGDAIQRQLQHFCIQHLPDHERVLQAMLVGKALHDGGTVAPVLQLCQALRKHIGTTLHKVFDRLTELSQSDSLIPGLSTGLRDLDTRINGLNKSDLLLIAARPAMGKSAFALNIGVNVAKKYKKTVAIFNLEMSREQLAMRLLASEGFVELQKLATGKLSEDEWSKLCMASAALSQTDIRIDDNPSVTVADINAKCRRLDNLGLVIIDYLQLMQGSGYGKNSDNRVTVVGEISRSLKIMAKELDVPVICLSQLSRAVESRTDKRPILSDLRESGAIEQDADSVMFLYRDEYYHENTEDKGVAECIVAKNRHGETGAVKMQWIGQYQTFADREWKHAE